MVRYDRMDNIIQLFISEGSHYDCVTLFLLFQTTIFKSCTGQNFQDERNSYTSQNYVDERSFSQTSE